jgi:hypothetical protein
MDFDVAIFMPGAMAERIGGFEVFQPVLNENNIAKCGSTLAAIAFYT